MTDQMPMIRREESKTIRREEVAAVLRVIIAIALCLLAWSYALHESAAVRGGCWAAHGQTAAQR